MFKDIFEEEMSRKSVFKDQSKLSPDFVPKSLVHREEEFRELARLFRSVLEDKASQRVLITGAIGVGKTALSLRFGRELESGAKNRGFRHDYIHINCRKEKTPHLVLQRLANQYFPRLPPRGFTPEEILEDSLKWLESRDAYLTVGLDELDYFIKQNGPDLLYSFTRAAEELYTPNRLSVIATSRTSGFLRLLDAPTRSTFMHNRIELDKYNAQQLFDILTERIKLSFLPGTIRNETVTAISEISSKFGDARFALELLWFAGRVADEKGAEEVVPEHVRIAKSRVYPEIRRDVVMDLERHEQLLLLALARKLKISNQAYVITGELKDSYEVVCEEYSEKPFKHTKIWGCLKRMSDLGLIETHASGRGMVGQSQKISLPDVPVEIVEEELEELLKK